MTVGHIREYLAANPAWEDGGATTFTHRESRYTVEITPERGDRLKIEQVMDTIRQTEGHGGIWTYILERITPLIIHERVIESIREDISELSADLALVGNSCPLIAKKLGAALEGRVEELRAATSGTSATSGTLKGVTPPDAVGVYNTLAVDWRKTIEDVLTTTAVDAEGREFAVSFSAPPRNRGTDLICTYGEKHVAVLPRTQLLQVRETSPVKRIKSNGVRLTMIPRGEKRPNALFRIDLPKDVFDEICKRFVIQKT